MKLQYQAVNATGQTVSGSVDAADAGQATEKLYLDGLYVTKISARAAGESRQAGGGRGVFGGGRLKHVAGFTRQMAVLTSTGTQVVQAIAAVERQIKEGPFLKAVQDIRTRVEEGEPLSEAMAQHPSYFDGVYRSLIAAGESGGNLHKMMDRLSVMTRKQLKIRHTIYGAMMYPTLLIGVSVVVVIVMLTGVLPRFAGLFDTLGAEMPPTTKVLMALSHSLRAYWWAWLLGTGMVVGGTVWGATSPQGKRIVDALMLRLPVFGGFTRNLITARIVRTLGVLMDGRVQLLEALTLCRAAAGNVHYQAVIDRAMEYVTHGDSMSTALKDQKLISPSVYEAVLTGERSGQVGPILLSLAEYLDEDNEVIAKSLTSLLEPLILIVLGSVVGLVTTSMFLPLFDLTAAAGAS